jgi:hypothetical protein
MVLESQTRQFLIIAQDPTIKDHHGRILTIKVSVPAEELSPGPRGHRVSVVDFDSTQGIFYEPADLNQGDDYEESSDEDLLNDPRFHAQNVYAIVIRTLARLEFALGRRVSWGFYGHHLQIAPHAMRDANAFYSEYDHGLFFGYFPNKEGKMIYTCLSHDVIAHETAHALLDGLRDHYTDPSLPDQAAFHEGFGDLVALLSVFSLREMIEIIVEKKMNREEGVTQSNLDADWLRQSPILGLAEQMGIELNPSGSRWKALRQSTMRKPSRQLLNQREPHLRGEILVAAILNVFAEVWEKRLKPFSDPIPLVRVSEEGEKAAEHLLNICIRALDYCPPVDLDFGDYLSALLTADFELVPDDKKYEYRKLLREGFKKWGIEPQSKKTAHIEEGIWEYPGKVLNYDRVHFDSLQRDPDEVFRFIWENRKELKVYEGAFTKVNWVRPCVRVGQDGFILRETVAEYIQMIDIQASDLHLIFNSKLKKPENMEDDVKIRLYGGGTLIFNEFGRLKYHIRKRIDDTKRQQAKIDYWNEKQMFDHKNRLGIKLLSSLEQFARLHRLRISGLKGGS